MPFLAESLRVSSASAVLFFAPLALSAQATPPAQTLTPSLQERVTQLEKMNQAWGPSLNSPGASIRLKEVSRDGATVTYRLYAEGLPRDTMYALFSFPVTQRAPSQNLSGITMDETGLAICAGKPGTCGSADKPNDPIDFKLTPVKGEPFRIGLISEDEKKGKAFVKIVPIPNQGTDRGCTVESVLLTPGAEAVEISGHGFANGADLKLETKSEGEAHEGPAKADAAGSYVTVILPYVKGTAKGVTHIRITSKECSPALEFEWGKRN